jgi:DNA helicase-4
MNTIKQVENSQIVLIARLKGLLQGYHYSDAEFIYKTWLKQVLSFEDYQVMCTISVCQHSREAAIATIQSLLSKQRLDDAETFCRLLRSTDSGFDYRFLLTNYQEQIVAEQQRQELLHELEILLQSYRFSEADKLIENHPLMSSNAYIALKLAALRCYFASVHRVELTDEQAQTIATLAHSLLITARAGSGKTRVLTCKAAYVIAHEGVAPEHLLLLAFNDKAATTMRDRMCNNFGFVRFDSARTFHKLAGAIVRPGDRLLGDGKDRKMVQAAIERAWSNRAFATLVLTYFATTLAEERTWSTGLTESEYYENKRDLKYLTLKGDVVKSLGEKYIADFLYEHGILYTYEYAHDWNGKPYRPDFTIFGRGELPAAVIEHWAIDEADPNAVLPVEWKQSASDYRSKMVEKRAYWRERQITLMETSIADLTDGRKYFENILKERLTAAGITCIKLSVRDLRAKLKVEKQDYLTILFHQFIQRAKQQRMKPVSVDIYEIDTEFDTREGVFWPLAMYIYQLYEEEKAEHNRIDFDDLLELAIAKIHQTKGNCAIDINDVSVRLNELQWALVDEFQDLSPLFFEMLNVLRCYNPRIKLFSVGDDWQAINGFAGGDLYYFRNFDQLFVEAQQINMLTNHRSYSVIVTNANALMKDLGPPATVHDNKQGGALYINCIDKLSFELPSNSVPDQTTFTDHRFLFDERNQQKNYMAERTLKRCWQIISDPRNEGKKLAILCRTNKIYGEDLTRFEDKLLSFFDSARKEQILISTVHRFKGLEADVVILVETTRGKFPLIHSDNQLFTCFVRDGQNVDRKAYEEEQRLFYVALTRASEKLWILTDSKSKSDFLSFLTPTGGQC